MSDETTTTAPAPAADAPEPAASPPAQPAAAAPWYEGFADSGVKDWVASIGAQSAEAVAAKALNLERMLGADRAGRTVVVPKAPDDPAWGEVYAKLGRPADPAGYQLQVPDGQSPEFATTAAQWFHKAGLTRTQAESVSSQWSEYVRAQLSSQQAAEQDALRKEHDTLKQAWGDGPSYLAQREIARRAAVKLGLDEGAIDALEKVTGFSKVMQALAKVGEMTGEDKAFGVGDSTGLTMTPEAARGRKAQLMADVEWRKKAMNPASAEWAEIQRLDRIIAAAIERAA